MGIVILIIISLGIYFFVVKSSEYRKKVHNNHTLTIDEIFDSFGDFGTTDFSFHL